MSITITTEPPKYFPLPKAIYRFVGKLKTDSYIPLDLKYDYNVSQDEKNEAAKFFGSKEFTEISAQITKKLS